MTEDRTRRINPAWKHVSTVSNKPSGYLDDRWYQIFCAALSGGSSTSDAQYIADTFYNMTETTDINYVVSNRRKQREEAKQTRQVKQDDQYRTSGSG